MKRFSVWYEYICRIIMNIFVVHAAFLVHTLMGAVIVGLFPSIAATYETYRAWLRADDHEWTARTTWTVFHRAWKSELRGANLFGYPLFALGALLVWEAYVVSANGGGTIGLVASGLFLVLLVAYALFASFVWMIRAHFDEKIGWIIRYSLSMIVARPLCSLILLALDAITVWAYVKWPGLAVAFGLSLPVFAASLTIYSYAHLPGLDARVIEGKVSIWKAPANRQSTATSKR